MNQTDFYNKFHFAIYKFKNYHLTDCTKKPVSRHYFGCLIKGTAIIKTPKTELSLKPGEIFYIPKGLKYQSEWVGKEIEFYSYGFEISPMNQSYVLQKINCSNAARKLFDDLCKEINFSQIRIGKLYYFFEQVADSMIISERKLINPTIENAIEYMTKNPNLKISEVAGFCNISEPGIYNIFKKHLGKTPNEVRNEILCKQAILLLKTTNKSVQDISDDLGFSSTSYFRKILYKHTHKTPREIRKDAVF